MRFIESAIMEVIIVPIEPVNKHFVFSPKQHFVFKQESPQDVKNMTPRMYTNINAAIPNAIQIPVVMNGMLTE